MSGGPLGSASGYLTALFRERQTRTGISDMKPKMHSLTCCIVAAVGLIAAFPCAGQQVKLAERLPDPHGSPRPANAGDVPVRTSIYFELEGLPGAKGGDVSASSVSVSLQPAGGAVAELLRGGRFAEGCRGWLEPKQDLQGKKALAVYIEPGASLKAATTYEVVVAAGVADKPASSAAAGRWSFTTETAQAVHRLNFALDLTSDPVRWHGRFFSGICNVLFCTQAANYAPTYDLMAEARKQHPNAWSFQRDFWMTGTEFRPQGFFPVNLPNIVRERETRRIAAIESRDEGILLRVEDFFGHRQYGIADGRPVGEDYHPGDEVLIADGAHDARTKVIAADSAAGTVTVAPFPAPEGGWKIAYEGPLPAVKTRTRRGFSPRADVISARSSRTVPRATTGAGWIRSGTLPTADMAGVCCPTWPMLPATFHAMDGAGRR